MTERTIKIQTAELLKKYYDDCFNLSDHNPSLLSHIIYNLDDIDEDVLRKILYERWDDPNVFRDLRVIFNCLNVLAAKFGPVKVFHHFLAVAKILGEGAQGVVSSAEFEPRDQGTATIAIKNVKGTDPDDFFALEREFIVGLQTNRVLGTPIFSKVLGYLSCSQVVRAGVTQSFCSKDLPATMITQLVPGVTFGSLIDKGKISETQFYKIFAILLDGLKKAEPIHYNHYDLHIDNVMIRTTPEEWNFDVLGGNVTSNFVPVLIDYGLSRVDVGGGAISHAPFADFTVGDKKIRESSEKLARVYGNSRNYCPLHDVYKFLYYTLYSSSVQRTPLAKQIAWMAEYFEPHPLQNLEQLRKKTNFVVPADFCDEKLDRYIAFIMKNQRFRHVFTPANSLLHTFGKYRDSLDFFKSIGLNLLEYRGLVDSSQWYFYKKLSGDGKADNIKIRAEMKKLYPSALEHIIDQLEEFIEQVFDEGEKLATDAQKFSFVAGFGDALISHALEVEAIREAAKDFKFSTGDLDDVLVEVRLAVVVLQKRYDELKRKRIDVSDIAQPKDIKI